MESERERVEGELEALLQLHSEVVRPLKCSVDDTPPLNSQDLAEELLLSPMSMLCKAMCKVHHATECSNTAMN